MSERPPWEDYQQSSAPWEDYQPSAAPAEPSLIDQLQAAYESLKADPVAHVKKAIAHGREELPHELEKIKKGVGASVIKSTLGLADVARSAGERLQSLPQVGPVPAIGAMLSSAGELAPTGAERETILEEMKRDIEQGGLTSQLAETGADIVSMLAPGTALMKGATAVAKATPVLKMFPQLSAAMATGGIEGYALTPEEDKTLATELGAAGGALGEGVGRLARRVFQPVRPSESASELLERNIVPSIGQGGEGIMGTAARALEDAGAQVPLAGELVRKGQQRAQRELSDEVLSQVGPQFRGRQPTREVVDEMSAHVRSLYDASLARIPPVEMSGPLLHHVDDMVLKLSPDAQKPVMGVIDRYITPGKVISPEELHAMTQDLRTLASTFTTSNNAAERLLGRELQTFQQKLKSNIFGDNLQAADKAYSNLQRVKTAVDYLGANETLLPRNLARAVKKEGGKTLQDLSDAAQILTVSPAGSALPRSLTAQAASLVTAPLGALSTSRPVARAAFGDYDIQKAVREYLTTPEVRAMLLQSGIQLPEDFQNATQ